MIREFQGPYRWLSNFWPVGNVERRYQAAKFSDDAQIKMTSDGREVIMVKVSNLILEATTPGDAKRIARRYKHLRRLDWHVISMKVMLRLLREKFQDPALRSKLLATGDEYLQEGNSWNDVFWGADIKTGKGENMLGRLIMQVRGEIRTGEGGLCA